MLALFMVTLMVFCGSPVQADSGEPVDEAEINNVWHKARLRGVSFRAIGQEPGWLLEVTDPDLIRKILDHLNSRTPSRLPPRHAESHQAPPDLFAEH